MMDFVRTINDFVACEPMPPGKIKQGKTAAGLPFVSTTINIIGLKVLLDTNTNGVFKGDTVYISQENIVNGWATKVYEFEGEKMILVPKSAIFIVKRGEGVEKADKLPAADQAFASTIRKA